MRALGRGRFDVEKLLQPHSTAKKEPAAHRKKVVELTAEMAHPSPRHLRRRRHATGDVFLEDRNFCVTQECGGGRGVIRDEWLDRVPVHERQILIGSVFRARDEWLQNLRPLREWQTGRGGRKIK